MTDAKSGKKPGELPPGKFHYNPGNMAGKTVNDCSDEATPRQDGDTPKPGEPKPRPAKPRGGESG